MQPNPDDIPIDLPEVRRLCSQTLSDCPPEDRCLAWMALLEVYPKNPNEWSAETIKYNSFYWNFVHEFNMDDWHTKYIPENPQNEMSPTLALIHIDIYRTARNIIYLPPSSPKIESDYMSPFNEHMRRLERILFIFSCCNPTLSYLQGFNELIMPLYYSVVSAPSLFRNDKELMEAVVFQMFQHLLVSTPIQNMYLMQDRSIVLHELDKFMVKIQQYLPKIADQMTQNGIKPAFFCFRWFTLLFAQEHELPMLLNIWDTILAHIDHLFEYTFCIGLGHLKVVESKIVDVDFSKSLEILQNMNISDVTPVIRFADNVWANELKMGKPFSFRDLFSWHS